MTWDQNSARALRRSLLEDANLRAIISLPQGLFVSKSGQGPKTSILYFEKGEPTRNVWFCKVSNDGYTMGTNRKPIAGCQLTEALDLFNRYVKNGDIPPDSRHSFTIPAEWIKTLDPRIKERIRTETTAELTARAAEERRKLEADLKRRLKEGKIARTLVDERLAQHDQLWRGKISATIAQKIERAHLYSFNLMAMYGQGKTRGKVALLKCPAAITQNCAAIVIHREDVVPKYVYYFLRSMYETIRGQEYSGAGVPHLNLKIVANIRVPLPSREEQVAVVTDIGRKLLVANGFRSMQSEAGKRILKTINAVWEH